jgi:hypothetical protein
MQYPLQAIHYTTPYYTTLHYTTLNNSNLIDFKIHVDVDFESLNEWLKATVLKSSIINWHKTVSHTIPTIQLLTLYNFIKPQTIIYILVSYDL